MDFEQYEYRASNDHLDFEFYSDGPKGKIRKIVRYRKKQVDGIIYFNLGFGDWNDATEKIDDLVISNNQDRDKILTTVALTLLEFTTYYPNAIVYVQGSTLSRTRLYQIGISLNWHIIYPLLTVYGFKSAGSWELFRKNESYLAFLITRNKL